jgi:tRNA (adenine57-N1/adenine58-N1)-methyltransferase
MTPPRAPSCGAAPSPRASASSSPTPRAGCTPSRSTPGKQFHTHRGHLTHDDLIGLPDGSTVTNTAGVEYLALRPLLSDYVMSMPRGAAVVYPKDAGQIVMMADIFPGAVVVEAGVGSGRCPCRCCAPSGSPARALVRAPRGLRRDRAGNARDYFGADHPAWTVTVGDLVERCRDRRGGTVDRVVLDMLAPWECLEVVARRSRPGACSSATSPRHPAVRGRRGDARPRHLHRAQAWESLVRGWHLEGLAVRPQHRMHGHTGFLITHRRAGPGVTPPAAQAPPGRAYVTREDAAEQDWTPRRSASAVAVGRSGCAACADR